MDLAKRSGLGEDSPLFFALKETDDFAEDRKIYIIPHFIDNFKEEKILILYDGVMSFLFGKKLKCPDRETFNVFSDWLEDNGFLVIKELVSHLFSESFSKVCVRMTLLFLISYYTSYHTNYYPNDKKCCEDRL